jgi:hypothetical protein
LDSDSRSVSGLCQTSLIMNSKIELGQFYTRNNPFGYPRFVNWLNSIPNLDQAKFIEPFGGANSIVQMILETFPEIQTSQWSSYDIHPEAQQKNLVPSVKLQRRDTISNFPEGFDICITNPPYLAKNSATRKGLKVDFGEFQDLFEVALNVMLGKSAYVAAIIPESFISRGLFTSRLEFVISLNLEMFDDTEFPVCLAVFSPEHTAGFEVWRGDSLIAELPQLDQDVRNLLKATKIQGLRFNDPNGPLGLTAVDGTKSPTIRFRIGYEIDSSEIKPTSRALTRISFPLLDQNPESLDDLILQANSVLDQYRKLTNDVFLTSFKGLRADGQYRRRLSWQIATEILATAAERIYSNNQTNYLF